MKLLNKLKSKTFWVAVLGAAGGFLAGQTPIVEAVKTVVDALFK